MVPPAQGRTTGPEHPTPRREIRVSAAMSEELTPHATPVAYARQVLEISGSLSALGRSVALLKAKRERCFRSGERSKLVRRSWLLFRARAAAWARAPGRRQVSRSGDCLMAPGKGNAQRATLPIRGI